MISTRVVVKWHGVHRFRKLTNWLNSSSCFSNRSRQWNKRRYNIFLNFVNGLFQITNSGDILTNMEIDAEEVTGPISLYIDANNPNPVNPDACSTNIRQSGLVVVTVSVLDLNDNAP